MNKIIKNSLIIFAVIIITISLIDGIMIQSWGQFKFFLQIAVVSVLICLIKYFMDKLQSRYYFLNILIEFTATLLLVLFFGWIFNWYQKEGIWLMCCTVLFAYIVCYFIGVLKTKKDIEIINEKLKNKKNQN